MTIQSSDEVIKTLTQLGLTSRQAKVYFFLAKLGTAKVSTISKVSKVPRQHVYEVMSTLKQLGLVREIVSSPIKFQSIPFREGLSSLLQNRIVETNDLATNTEKLLQNFTTEYSKERIQQREKYRFVLVPEKKAVNRQIVDNIENAQMSIEVVCTWKRYFEAECNYSEAYKKVLKKGVKILQVTELPRDKLDLTRAIEIERMFKDYPSNQVRYFPGRITTVFALIDKKAIFMAL